MDIHNAFHNLNWLAIVIAAVSAFLLGFIWYSLLFSKKWALENGFNEESNKNVSMLKIFGLSFLLMLLASFILALFIGKDAGLHHGINIGFHAGLGFGMTFLGVIYLFERRSLALYLINGFYTLLSLTLMGLIIGIMQ
ncbi:MAG TPA: DUF1761 domain-containing protein [Bacteroidales bacterium]|nr:DUF1761 domain-containing protein [Bacteroidales bacterium]